QEARLRRKIEMFQDIEQDDAIKVIGRYQKAFIVQIRLAECVQGVTIGWLDRINATDVAVLSAFELRSPQSPSATQIVHTCGGRNMIHGHRVGRNITELQSVTVFARKDVEITAIQDFHLLQPGKNRRLHHVNCVSDAVDTTYLIAVIRGNRNFLDTQLLEHEL